MRSTEEWRRLCEQSLNDSQEKRLEEPFRPADVVLVVIFVAIAMWAVWLIWLLAS